MNYKFKIEEEALKELENILDYITNVLKNPNAATDLYREILNTIDNIKVAAQGFAYSRNERLAHEGIRQVPVKSYQIFYIVDDLNFRFTVLHIKYAASDFNAIPLPN